MMQLRQPIQRSWSIITMPSVRLNVAPTGQARTQGGLSQCMQGFGKKYVPAAGLSLISITFIHSCIGGTKCILLHALVQSPQPSHLAKSITITHFLFPGTLDIQCNASLLLSDAALQPKAAKLHAPKIILLKSLRSTCPPPSTQLPTCPSYRHGPDRI